MLGVNIDIYLSITIYFRNTENCIIEVIAREILYRDFLPGVRRQNYMYAVVW